MFDRFKTFFAFAFFAMVLWQCLPATNPAYVSDGGEEGGSGSHPLKAARQVAITPTGNGFFKVVSSVPVGGINTPTGATVDLSTSNDVSNTLQYTHGGTGLASLGLAGQGICVNPGVTGFTYCTFGSSSSSGGTSAGAVNTVQLSDGAGSFLAATNVLGGTNFLSIGTTPATAGEVRGSKNVLALAALNNAGSGNIAIAETGTVNTVPDNVLIGTTAADTSKAAGVIVRPSSIVILGTGTTNQFAVGAGLGSFAAQNQNLAVLGSQTTPSYAGGTGEFYIGNTSVPPSSSPTAGGILYSELGTLRHRNSTGYITSIAPSGIARVNYAFSGTHVVTALEASHGTYTATGTTIGSAAQYTCPTSDEDSFYKLIQVGRDVACGGSGACVGTFTVQCSSGTTATFSTNTASSTTGFVLFTSAGVISATAQLIH